jgi:hypothetical protein
MGRAGPALEVGTGARLLPALLLCCLLAAVCRALGGTGRGRARPAPTPPPTHPRTSPPALALAPRGDVGQHREAHYSRGIRQKLRKMALKHQWLVTQNVSINEMSTYTADYSESMSKSLFCVVAPGARRRAPAAACVAGRWLANSAPERCPMAERTRQSRPLPA